MGAAVSKVGSNDYRLQLLPIYIYIYILSFFFSCFVVQIVWCAGVHYLFFCPRVHCGWHGWPNHLTVSQCEYLSRVSCPQSSSLEEASARILFALEDGWKGRFNVKNTHSPLGGEGDLVIVRGPSLLDDRPSHPYNAGTEHVGFSLTR